MRKNNNYLGDPLNPLCEAEYSQFAYGGFKAYGGERVYMYHKSDDPSRDPKLCIIDLFNDNSVGQSMVLTWDQFARPLSSCIWGLDYQSPEIIDLQFDPGIKRHTLKDDTHPYSNQFSSGIDALLKEIRSYQNTGNVRRAFHTVMKNHGLIKAGDNFQLGLGTFLIQTAGLEFNRETGLYGLSLAAHTPSHVQGIGVLLDAKEFQIEQCWNCIQESDPMDMSQSTHFALGVGDFLNLDLMPARNKKDGFYPENESWFQGHNNLRHKRVRLHG